MILKTSRAQYFWACLISILIHSACTKQSTITSGIPETPPKKPGGTGDGIGGGDLLLGQLKDARDSILSVAVEKIKAGEGVGMLCDFRKCAKENEPFCQTAPQLNAIQRSYCAQFVSDNFRSLDFLLKSVPLRVSDAPLEVDSFEVDMRTSLSGDGPIEVSRARVGGDKFSLNQMAALLGHEYFHKVNDPRTGYTNDNVETGPFVGEKAGSALLTAAGYALVYLARDLYEETIESADLRISPSASHDFGIRPLGSTTEQTFDITNHGEYAAQNFSIQLPANFIGEMSTCTGLTTLAVNASCKVKVKFSPTVQANHIGSLVASYDNGQGIQSVEIWVRGKARIPLIYVSTSRGAGSAIASRLRVYNATTGEEMTSLGVNGKAPFGDSYDGEIRLAAGDVDNDGKPDLAVGTSHGFVNQVSMFDVASGNASNTPLANISPFGAFGGGVFLAMGDLNMDSKDDLFVGAGESGGPHVRVYDSGGAVKHSYFALESHFPGGVRIGAGDINGDHRADILTASGPGRAVYLQCDSGFDLFRIFENGYYPFGQFSAGAFLATGDFNGDGRGDYATAADRSGGPHIKVFDGATPNMISQAFVFHDGVSPYYGGVTIAAGDVDGDGKAEIIGAPRSGGNFPIRILKAADLSLIREIPLPDSAATAVFVTFSYSPF